jgi:hypothetical protein
MGANQGEDDDEVVRAWLRFVTVISGSPGIGRFGAYFRRVLLCANRLVF